MSGGEPLPADAEALVRLQEKYDELREENAELRRDLNECSSEGDFRYQLVCLLLALLLRNEMPLRRVEALVSDAMELMRIGRSTTGNAFQILLSWRQLDDLAGGWFRQIRDEFEAAYVEWDSVEEPQKEETR